MKPLLYVLVGVVVADLSLWGGHVLWRARAMHALQPVVEQFEHLEDQLSEDDLWIQRNGRLTQGYGRHREYAQRLELRAQRARARDMLVEAYNARGRSLFRRFYLAPTPKPAPPFLEVAGPPR